MVTDCIDESIVVALTHSVRVLSVDQIAAHRWEAQDAPLSGAEERVRRLAAAGLLELQELLARPELPLAVPELSWTPGSAEKPELGRVAYRLKTRWRAKPVPTTVVMATAEAGKRFGGFNRGYRLRADDLTHDLHMGRVWMHYQRKTELAALWVGEGQLRAEGADRDGVYGGRLPDAVLREDRSAPPQLIIEFAGAYAKSKLGDIHRAFRKYPYELW